MLLPPPPPPRRYFDVGSQIWCHWSGGPAARARQKNIECKNILSACKSKGGIGWKIRTTTPSFRLLWQRDVTLLSSWLPHNLAKHQQSWKRRLLFVYKKAQLFVDKRQLMLFRWCRCHAQCVLNVMFGAWWTFVSTHKGRKKSLSQSSHGNTFFFFFSKCK